MKQILKVNLSILIFIVTPILMILVAPPSQVKAMSVEACINEYDGKQSKDASAFKKELEKNDCLAPKGPCKTFAPVGASVLQSGAKIEASCSRSNVSGSSQGQLNAEQCKTKYHGDIYSTMSQSEKDLLSGAGCLQPKGPCLLIQGPVQLIDCKNEFGGADLSAAGQYCSKYEGAGVRYACMKGYTFGASGDSVCDDFVNAQRKAACKDGAKGKAAAIKKNSDANNSSGDEESPVGTQYDSEDCSEGLNGECKLVDMIVTITNAISGLAAVVIVAMIIVGGIQYSMAGTEAAKVQAAKQKIINALLALLLLVFGFSIIQWLVPGGLI